MFRLGQYQSVRKSHKSIQIAQTQIFIPVMLCWLKKWLKKGVIIKIVVWV